MCYSATVKYVLPTSQGMTLTFHFSLIHWVLDNKHKNIFDMIKYFEIIKLNFLECIFYKRKYVFPFLQHWN